MSDTSNWEVAPWDLAIAVARGDLSVNAATGEVTQGTGVALPGGPAATDTPTSNRASVQAILLAALKDAGIDGPDALAYSTQFLVDHSDVSDAAAGAQLHLDLYDASTTVGKIVAQRYPEIAARRALGEQITVANAIDYHNGVKDLFRRRNIPAGFYDTEAEISDLATKGQSLVELEDRINKGYSRVVTADPTIRAAFTHYFGADGDAALATYFLDPAKSIDILEKQVTAAEVGGVATQFGFNINAARAAELQDRGATGANSRDAFAKVQANQPLFDETISETTDLTAEREGIDTAFQTGDTSPDVLRRRLAERKAAFGGDGGAFGSDAGRSGLGSARSR